MCNHHNQPLSKPVTDSYCCAQEPRRVYILSTKRTKPKRRPGTAGDIVQQPTATAVHSRTGVCVYILSKASASSITTHHTCYTPDSNPLQVLHRAGMPAQIDRPRPHVTPAETLIHSTHCSPPTAQPETNNTSNHREQTCKSGTRRESDRLTTCPCLLQKVGTEGYRSRSEDSPVLHIHRRAGVLRHTHLPAPHSRTNSYTENLVHSLLSPLRDCVSCGDHLSESRTAQQSC
jgi:hypothetical protein